MLNAENLPINCLRLIRAIRAGSRLYRSAHVFGAMRRRTYYGLTLLGLIGGLVFLLFTPLPSAMLNYLVGGALLTVAVASVTYLIAEFSGPGERGPDF